jgi:hypothetical protein
MNVQILNLIAIRTCLVMNILDILFDKLINSSTSWVRSSFFCTTVELSILTVEIYIMKSYFKFN